MAIAISTNIHLAISLVPTDAFRMLVNGVEVNEVRSFKVEGDVGGLTTASITFLASVNVDDNID